MKGQSYLPNFRSSFWLITQHEALEKMTSVTIESSLETDFVTLVRAPFSHLSQQGIRKLAVLAHDCKPIVEAALLGGIFRVDDLGKGEVKAALSCGTKHRLVDEGKDAADVVRVDVGQHERQSDDVTRRSHRTGHSKVPDKIVKQLERIMEGLELEQDMETVFGIGDNAVSA